MESVIIYYTSNREDPGLEKRVMDNILQVSTLPIISVSQKPITGFGTNICVGDVGVSGFNMFRQVLVGCKAAKGVDFVISAEADCLYPPDYFKFVPPTTDTCYRDHHLFVMGHRRDYFYKKDGATHAQVIGREFYIDQLDRLFKGAPDWSTTEFSFPKERWHHSDVFDSIVYYWTDNPVVQIKTGCGMRRHTRSERTPIYNIPYWGDSKEFRKKYYDTVRRH